MKPLLIALTTNIDPGALPTNSTNANTLQTILGIIFGILGAFALLVIVISGFRYILSAGDPEKATKARNGIIYALVGLVVAISADAIVSFVIKRI